MGFFSISRSGNQISLVESKKTAPKPKEGPALSKTLSSKNNQAQAVPEAYRRVTQTITADSELDAYLSGLTAPDPKLARFRAR